jgi:NAD(P)-dependent dehydrogenase (short-subunit alcohol dehydrogenase family)
LARTAVITGGEGDLARAAAGALEEGGFEVFCPGRAELDVCDAGSVGAYFGRLESIDLLVNNAGIIRDRLLPAMSEEEWDVVVETNLRGAFLCARAAVKLMVRARSGHIVNIASFSGAYGAVGQANYAAAKSGMIGLTKSLSLELGKRNVRVNAVMPGFLRTKLNAHLSEERWAAVLEAHALGRLNTVEGAARFIAFLDTMEHVSGQVFQLDSRVGRMW